MKQVLKWFLKAAAAGLIALLLLCALCLLYYRLPVHIQNDTGATEYRWEGSTFYRKGTEGFAFNRTNNDGFDNLRDYEQGDDIDILLMGSSHMEAMNVPLRENTAARLNEMFGGDKYVYNIGTSGHTLLYCIKHLDRALEHYAPGDYVIIETRDVSFPLSEMEQTLDGTLPDIPSQTGLAVTVMKKLPYLRLFYTKHIKGANDVDAAKALGDTETADDAAQRAELMGELMARVAETCAEHGVQPMIVYHPTLYVDDEGEPYTVTDGDDLAALRELCEDEGIIFADATDGFLNAYRQYYRLPYGFANTAPGKGHMNSWGHSLFARCIYDAIEETEAAR